MSDINCRICGEPWDSTGGIHHSHSDLTLTQYEALVDGRGCPCCCGELTTEGLDDFGAWFEMTQDEVKEAEKNNLEAWRRSVERLSEGEPDYMFATFDKKPKPPFKDADRYEPVE